MRYQGDISQNLSNASEAKDTDLAKNIILDEVVTLIEDNPQPLLNALRYSDVNISDSSDKKEIADKTAYALTYNATFPNQLAIAIGNNVKGKRPVRPEYSNAVDPVSAISEAASGLFGTVGDVIKTQGAKRIEEERTKQVLYAKLFGEKQKKKTNWIPIIAVASVMIIGGIVVWRVTKK